MTWVSIAAGLRLRDLRGAICEEGVVHSHRGKQTLNYFGGDSRSLIRFFCESMFFFFFFKLVSIAKRTGHVRVEKASCAPCRPSVKSV